MLAEFSQGEEGPAAVERAKEARDASVDRNMERVGLAAAEDAGEGWSTGAREEERRQVGYEARRNSFTQGAPADLPHVATGDEAGDAVVDADKNIGRENFGGELSLGLWSRKK